MKTSWLRYRLYSARPLLPKKIKYFYSHPGVNLLAVSRAFIKNIFRMKRTSGAALLPCRWRVPWNTGHEYLSKIIEMFRAFQLEWKYSKDEYYNVPETWFLRGNIEGVKSSFSFISGKAPSPVAGGNNRLEYYPQPALLPGHW